MEYGTNGNIYIVGSASFYMYSPSDNSVYLPDSGNNNSEENLGKFQLSNYPNPFNPVTTIIISVQNK